MILSRAGMKKINVYKNWLTDARKYETCPVEVYVL
jgi:hypothetical protein